MSIIPEYINVMGKQVKFEWCFNIEQIVEVNASGWTPECKKDDKFVIAERKYEDDNQWFTVKRLSDGEVWENVGARDIIELDDEAIEVFWRNMEDIPFDDVEGEMILAEKYLIWEEGTNRDEIWYWFNEYHSKGVAYLLNEMEG